MKLYRFSPIENKEQLLEAIKHIHFASYKLCKQSFGEYLTNAGNVGVFCHYPDEYDALVAIRDELVEPSDDPNQKYFTLRKPIVIPATGDILETTYTHLYIRKPDPYRHHVGDIDFYIEQQRYNDLKYALTKASRVIGMRAFPRNDLDMIELYDPDIDVLAYVSTSAMTEKVKIKLSNETNL